MLTSIILQLTAQQNGRIRTTGRAVHGFWFNQWQRIDPHTANSLHQNNQTKPFTLSPLMGLPPTKSGSSPIQAGHKAWLRLTSLQANLSQNLLQNWLPRLPSNIQLADIPWQISNIALAPQEHPWAGQTSYAALAEAALPNKKWTFKLETPTTFHIGADAHLPFPLPGALLNSWWRRWDTFSPQPLPPLERQQIQQQLFISQYRLKTVPVRYGRRLTVGCVGTFSLRAGKLNNETRRTIDTLARYATFCGSGRYTTQGMGVTIFD